MIPKFKAFLKETEQIADVDIWFECNILGYDSKKVVAIHCEALDD